MGRLVAMIPAGGGGPPPVVVTPSFLLHDLIPTAVFDPNSSLSAGGPLDATMAAGAAQGGTGGARLGTTWIFDTDQDDTRLNLGILTDHIHNGPPPANLAIGVGYGWALAGTGSGGLPASMAEVDHYLLGVGRSDGTDSFAAIAWHNTGSEGYTEDPAASSDRHQIRLSTTFYEADRPTLVQSFRQVSVISVDADTGEASRFGNQQQAFTQNDLYGGAGMKRFGMISVWRHGVLAVDSTIDLTYARLVVPVE